MTGTRLHDASIPTKLGSLRHTHSVTSNCPVCPNDQGAHTPRIIHTVRTAHVAHVIHDTHDYPNGTIWGYNDNDEA
jgi:hypothetical protein